MSFSTLRRAAIACLVALGTAGIAEAQQVATSFEQLRALVKNGDSVVLTDQSGVKIKGKIVDLSASSLSLTSEGTRRDLAESNVRSIHRRTRDSLANGAILGGLAGAIGGFLVISSATCSGCHWEPDTLPLMVSALGGGIGAGIGLGADAAARRTHLLFSNPAASESTTRHGPVAIP